MLSFLDAVKVCTIKKPLNFKDRAPRSEYWWCYLFLVIANIVMSIIGLIPIIGQIVYLVWSIYAIFISLSAFVRRLHDLNHSGWWIIAPYVLVIIGVFATLIGYGIQAESFAYIGISLSVIAGIGFIVLFIMAMLRGTVGPNRFGPDPLASINE